MMEKKGREKTRIERTFGVSGGGTIFKGEAILCDLLIKVTKQHKNGL